MLVLPPQLTHDEAAACVRMLSQALASQPPRQAAVADAGPLQQFDSSALAVLLECRREALAQGRSVSVTNMPPRLQELASVYGVSEVLAPPA